jgi:hypothetical protein
MAAGYGVEGPRIAVRFPAQTTRRHIPQDCKLHISKRTTNFTFITIGIGNALNCRGIGVRFPAGKEIFLFCTASRPALGSTQPPIQWVARDLSLG